MGAAREEATPSALPEEDWGGSVLDWPPTTAPPSSSSSSCTLIWSLNTSSASFLLSSPSTQGEDGCEELAQCVALQLRLPLLVAPRLLRVLHDGRALLAGSRLRGLRPLRRLRLKGGGEDGLLPIGVGHLLPPVLRVHRTLVQHVHIQQVVGAAGGTRTMGSAGSPAEVDRWRRRRWRWRRERQRRRTRRDEAEAEEGGGWEGRRDCVIAAEETLRAQRCERGAEVWKMEASAKVLRVASYGGAQRWTATAQGIGEASENGWAGQGRRVRQERGALVACSWRHTAAVLVMRTRWSVGGRGVEV